MSSEVFTVECPCGAVMSESEMAVLTKVVQEHGQSNHDMVLSAEDVQDMAQPVLSVRLSGDFDDSTPVIETLLASIPVPVPGAHR